MPNETNIDLNENLDNIEAIEDNEDNEANNDTITDDAENQEENEESTEDDLGLKFDDNGNIDEDELDNIANDQTETEETEETQGTETNEEFESLKKKYAALEKATKRALKHMEIEKDDVLEGLIELSAQATDQSVEDYRKTITEEEELEEAKEYIKRKRYEEILASDLVEIQKAYPMATKFAKMTDVPNFNRFSQLRASGSSAIEAFAATHTKEILESASNASKQKVLNDNKKHLQSNVSKTSSSSNKVTITRAEMQEWRDLFPDKSDKEIIRLYNKTK